MADKENKLTRHEVNTLQELVANEMDKGPFLDRYKFLRELYKKLTRIHVEISNDN